MMNLGEPTLHSKRKWRMGTLKEVLEEFNQDIMGLPEESCHVKYASQ